MNLHLTALGVRIRIVAVGNHAEELASAAREAWQSCLTREVSEGAIDVLAVLDSREDFLAQYRSAGVVAGTRLDEVMDALSPRVTRTAIEARAGELLMLHACAVADPDGRSLVFVGPSGAGKTTVATVLGREFGYVTDETVGIRDDLSIETFSKPLSILDGRPGVKSQRSPSSLGLRQAPGRCRVRRIVLLDRGGTSRRDPFVQPVKTVEGLSLLASETSFLAKIDAPLHRLAAVLSATGGLTRVSYADARDLGPLAQDLLDEP